MSKLKLKKPLLALLLAATVCSLDVYASKELARAALELHSNIIGPSCTAVTMSNTPLNIKLPDTTLERIEEIKRGNSSHSHWLPEKKIQIQCNSGQQVNFSINTNQNDVCVTDSGIGYICRGKNKSVGISPEIKWVDPSGATKSFNGYTHEDSGKVNPIKLDAQYRAVVEIPRIYLRTIRGKEPEPGEIAADFVLKVWSQ